jgi:hypothetical protein
MIAPSNAVRVLLFFGDGRYVWSEEYFRAGSDTVDPTADDQAALTLMTKSGGVADKRVQMLGAGVQLLEIRASRDNVFRDSLISEQYAEWQQPKGAVPDLEIYNTGYCDLADTPKECEQAAEPQVCLRVRCESTAVRRRIMYLSGVPQFADIPGANVPLPATIDPTGKIDTGVFNLAFNNWAGQVLTDQWGFVGIQYTNNAPIGNVTTNVGGTQVTVLTKSPLSVTSGDTVLIFHPQYFPGSYNFHGQKEVATVTQIPGPPPITQLTFSANIGNADLSYKAGGIVKGPAVRVFNVFTAIYADGIAKRSRGFAELAIRGRSRTRRNFVG